MEKLIACCGLNCATCDISIATVLYDNELRAKTAAKMKDHYNLSDISVEVINCTGCREAGVTMMYCEKCDIRNCVLSNSFQNCAECDIMVGCQIAAKIHLYEPDALENLKSLN